MVKTIISTVLVAMILIAGAIYENNFIQKQFTEFNTIINALYEKTDEQTAVIDDVLTAQYSWREKKRYLHAFIPHTEIKEVELWLSETVVLVREDMWSEALSKLEVLKDLATQIPKNFLISWENVL